MSNDIDLDDLLSLTPDDEKTAVEEDVTAAEVKEEAPAPEAAAEAKPEPKKRAPRKPRASKDEIVSAEIKTAETLETPEQRRIRELEAQLAQPVLKPTTDAAGRPLPDSQLDEEQRRIRELEDRLAQRHAQAVEASEPQYIAPSQNTGEILHIHFLEDGLLVNGVTTYRGQEMKFEIGGLAYQQTKNRLGESFLDLVDDIGGQWARWGKQYIGRGPWRGEPWGAVSQITDPQARADAEAAARQEQRRAAAAPVSQF